MNSNQLNEYVNQLQQYSRQDQDLKVLMYNTFKEKLNECQKMLGLQQLKYIEISKEQNENLNKFYQQGRQYDCFINQMYYDKDDYQNAIKFFDQVLEIDRQNLDPFYYKGISLRMMKKYQESIEWAEKALDRDPKHKFALFNKGEILRKLDQYQESLI